MLLLVGLFVSEVYAGTPSDRYRPPIGGIKLSVKYLSSGSVVNGIAASGFAVQDPDTGVYGIITSGDLLYVSNTLAFYQPTYTSSSYNFIGYTDIDYWGTNTRTLWIPTSSYGVSVSPEVFWNSSYRVGWYKWTQEGYVKRMYGNDKPWLGLGWYCSDSADHDKGGAVVAEVTYYSGSPPKGKAFGIHMETVTVGLTCSDVLYNKIAAIPYVLDELNVDLVLSSGGPH